MKYVVLVWKVGAPSIPTKAVVTADSKTGAEAKTLSFVAQYRTEHPESVAVEAKSIRLKVLTVEEYIKTQPAAMRSRARAQLNDLIEEIGDDVYIPNLDPDLGERRWHSKHLV